MCPLGPGDKQRVLCYEVHPTNDFAEGAAAVHRHNDSASLGNGCWNLNNHNNRNNHHHNNSINNNYHIVAILYAVLALGLPDRPVACIMSVLPTLLKFPGLQKPFAERRSVSSGGVYKLQLPES